MPLSSDQVKLVVVYAEDMPGLEVGQVIPLSAQQFVISRTEPCDLRIDDARISRPHATLALEGERYSVTDLHSVNGTFVNAVRLAAAQKHLLRNGDELAISTGLVLRYVDEAATVAEARSAPLRGGLHLGDGPDGVTVNFKAVEPPLTAQQFRLLEILTERPGEVVSLADIAAGVWPGGQAVSNPMIDNLVARVRQRLSRLDPGHDYLQRVHGKGLRFVQRK